MHPLPQPQTAMQWIRNRHPEAGSTPGAPAQHNHPAPVSVVQEHAVLMRHMGRLQTRVSGLLADQEAQLQALSGEVLRLRGQLVVARTAVLWGLALRTASKQPTAQRNAIQSRGAGDMARLGNSEWTRQLVCQTGCVGHAHHWLTTEGTCQLSGQACERQALESPLGKWPAAFDLQPATSKSAK